MSNNQVSSSTGEPRRPRVLLITSASFTMYGFGIGLIMGRFIQEVNKRGGDATGMALSDDESSDTRFKEALNTTKFDIISFGPLVRNSGAWGDRIGQWIAESESRDCIFSLPTGPEDTLLRMEQALEQWRQQQQAGN